MGSLVGHVLPGLGFILIGLWHLLNNIKLHALHPNSFTSLAWFPTSKIRYLELFLIMGGSTASMAMELFIGPARHHPFDTDGTIPSYHLHNFEHFLIGMTFFMCAAFIRFLDRIEHPMQHALGHLLGAVAFGQQLLLFHFHSTDHMGVEGQYHWLLQIVIFVSLLTTLMGISNPKSFLITFVRSFSIFFQGVWLIVMGIMLWTPALVPKGCFLNFEEGHQVVRCRSDEALERAKALVNIEFSWYVVFFIILTMCSYLFLTKIYPEKVEYQSLMKNEHQGEEVDDIEAQKRINKSAHSKSFIPMGKVIAAINGY